MFLIDSKLRWYLDIYDEIIDKKSLEHILQYSKKSAKYSKKNVYSRRLEYIIISAFLLYFKILNKWRKTLLNLLLLPHKQTRIDDPSENKSAVFV